MRKILQDFVRIPECHLTPTGLEQAAAWLDEQRATWNDRLDRLETHLNEHPAHNNDSWETKDN